MAKKIIYNIAAKQRKIGTLTHAFGYVLIPSFAKTGLLIFMVHAYSYICRPVVSLCCCSVLISTDSCLSFAVS